MLVENSNIRACIAVGLGAIAGSLCRYYTGQWLTQSIDTAFPIGTGKIYFKRLGIATRK